MTATLDQILDAVAGLSDKERQPAPELSYEGITCWKSDPPAAKFIAEWIATYGPPWKPNGARRANKPARTGDSQTTGDNLMDSNAEFSEAQTKADFTYRAFGDQAPPPMRGESVHDYRTRLVSKFQKWSKTFASANLANIGCGVTLGAIEDQIYADATTALYSGGTAGRGLLVPIVTMDAANRPMKRYVASDDGACWDQFNPPIRFVTRFITARH